MYMYIFSIKMYFKKKNGVLSHRLVMGIKPFHRPKLLRQGMSHSECCVIPRISSALFFFFPLLEFICFTMLLLVSAVQQSGSALCTHISPRSHKALSRVPCAIKQQVDISYLLYIVLGEGNGTPLQYSCLENPMDGGAWWAAVHGVARSRTRLSDFTFTFQFHALEKEMATHSSVLAWRIPGMGKPGGLPSMGSHRVGHD